jgi:hypothetical protein
VLRSLRAAPPPAGKPTYFGVFGIPPDKAHDWPFTVSRAGPEDMSQLQGAGLKGLVALTGSKKNYSDASGCFQLGMWKTGARPPRCGTTSRAS